MSIIQSLTFNTLIANRGNSEPQFCLSSPIYSSEGYSVTSFYGVNSFYTIDSRNNKFSFSESDTSSTVRTVTIPTGNYTVTSFITQLTTSMNAAGTQVYAITKSDLTNIITITAPTKTWRILAVANDCYYESGFKVSSSNALVQTASSVYDFSGVKILNISSNSFGNGNNVLVGKSLNIIASIPITVPALGVISFTNNSSFISTSISELTTVEFIIYDELFRQLTILNPWQISIFFQI